MSKAIKLHAYFSKLFEAFEHLPLRDIELALREEMPKYLADGLWHEYERFLIRAKTYLDNSSLDSSKRQFIQVFLDSEAISTRAMIEYPECRFVLNSNDRFALKQRLYTLLNGEEFSHQAASWLLEDYAITLDDSTIKPKSRSVQDIERNARLIPDEDAANRIEVLKICLRMLDEWDIKTNRRSITKRKGEIIAISGDVEHAWKLPKRLKVDTWKPNSPLPNPLKLKLSVPGSYLLKEAASRLHAPVQAVMGRPKVSGAAHTLTLSDLVVSPFSLAELADLASKIGLVDKDGRYQLGPRKLGAIVGFCSALKFGGKLRGTIPDLVSMVAPLFKTEVKTRKASTDIARFYFDLTTAELDSK